MEEENRAIVCLFGHAIAGGLLKFEGRDGQAGGRCKLVSFCHRKAVCNGFSSTFCRKELFCHEIY